MHQQKPGHVLWLSRSLFLEILRLETSVDFRFDDWVRPKEMRLDLDDPGLLHNINTPEDWARTLTTDYSPVPRRQAG
jgi:CTP:molybdopterin cytidylyltransferase MocA